MPDVSEAPPYYVRATDPASNEQTVYECVGFAMAHAKAAELRMSGYRDVVMSIRNAKDKKTAAQAQPVTHPHEAERSYRHCHGCSCRRRDWRGARQHCHGHWDWARTGNCYGARIQIPKVTPLRSSIT